jgi:programmed cell death protein 5
MSGAGLPSGLDKAGFSMGEPSAEQAEMEEKRRSMDEARNAMLKSILTPEAKERLSRVSLVKPENARAVEEHIIRLARQNKLQGKIDEDTLKKMLEDVGKLAESASGGVKKVVIVHKKKNIEDDDDDDNF